MIDSLHFKCDRSGLKAFGLELFRRIKKHGEPVFLCVGTDKVVCDSLAPIVAEILREKYSINSYIYGGLQNIIHAQNLMEAVRYLEAFHADKFIVLIDATVGANVGEIVVTDGAYAGMGNTLPMKKVGDMSILGVVGSTKRFDLYSTRLGSVVRLARYIAMGIATYLNAIKEGDSKTAELTLNTLKSYVKGCTKEFPLKAIYPNKYAKLFG